MPRLSLIIPIYNQAAYIGHLLDSILRQSYSDYEIIIIDDGSSDDLTSALAPYQTHIHTLIHQANAGAAARNHALEQAQGEFIAFLDADDWLMRDDYLAEAIERLDEYAAIGILQEGWCLVSETSQQTIAPWHTHPVLDWDTVLRHTPVLLPAMLFRRRAIGTCRFPEQHRQSEDTDFIFQVVAQGVSLAWYPQVVYAYRLHPASTTHRHPHELAYETYTFWERWFQHPSLPFSIRKDLASLRFYKRLWALSLSLESVDEPWLALLVEHLRHDLGEWQTQTSIFAHNLIVQINLVGTSAAYWSSLALFWRMVLNRHPWHHIKQLKRIKHLFRAWQFRDLFWVLRLKLHFMHYRQAA